MTEKNYKSIIEDSSRNRLFFYYSNASVCCKEISKDGLTKDLVIASQVSENFLAAIDLQDHIYVVCINKDQGLYLFSYENSEWKLDQILNIQGDGGLYLLSLLVHNGSTHIIYAKQMTIANFYNIHHLYKPGNPNAYNLSTSWRKNNVGEIYAENIDSAYSSIITKDGIIHLVNEWFDGNKYLINYSWYDNNNDTWRRKTVTSLFKKDIKVSILYEEGILHLLCYSFEDEVSAIFCYTKKENSNRDFEFYCLDKIKTEQAISPFFHVEGSSVYMSWLYNNRYGQYSMSREQKNWSKKLDNQIDANDLPMVIEYIRNRKGRALVNKQTYFYIDNKHNISLPYFKDGSTENNEALHMTMQSPDTELTKLMPNLLEELNSLSEIVKGLSLRMDQLDNRRPQEKEKRLITSLPSHDHEQKLKTDDSIKLKKSGFREQFMSTNKLLGRPEAAALYVSPSSIPNPEALSKKEEIKIVENNQARFDEKVIEKQAYNQYTETEIPEQENEKTKQETVKPNQEVEKPNQEVEEPNQEIEKLKREIEKLKQKIEKPKQEIENQVQETDKPMLETEKPMMETENRALETENRAQETEKPLQEIEKSKQEIETTTQKDLNLFKKIGDFFK
jgi:hypothetical protein